MQRIYSSSLAPHTASAAATVRDDSYIKNDVVEYQTRLLKAITEDKKEEMIYYWQRLIMLDQEKEDRRKELSKMLHLCCAFDAAECAAALLGGEVEEATVPLLNEFDVDSGMSPLHAAATVMASRCVELLLKRHARTDLRSRDGRGLTPLELSLSTVRMDVRWNPDEQSIEDLIVQLSEKDLTTIELLSEKTKEIGEVAYAIAIGGRVVDLATLLAVSADRVNDSILKLHDSESDSNEKTTIYECVIREALALGRSSTMLYRAAKRSCVLSERECERKRKLLLFEIGLLQLFGATAHSSNSLERKVALPLILASQAVDEAVVELLLKSNIDVNDVDHDGNSALHWCLKTSKGSSVQQIKIMSLLLNHGSRVSQKNKLGLTAIHLAAANGNVDALQVLLSVDPDCVNCKTEIKETPLFFAVKNNRKECVELLLRWGASTEVLNLRKQRPIDLAESQDMRVMLSPTSISLTNRASQAQHQYTALLRGDEVMFESCQEISTLRESGNSSDRISSSPQVEICKYFDSPGGCARGTSCFYLHAEEELFHTKHGRETIHSPTGRKVFVGGLPPFLDSDSLKGIMEERFGTVEHAMISEIQTGDKVQSRGFGFVIFKHKISVSEAIETHHVDIMGKQVEIKSAVPKSVLVAELQKSPRFSDEESETQTKAPTEKPEKDMCNSQGSGKCINKLCNCKKIEDTIAKGTSWVNMLVTQPKEGPSGNSQPKREGMPRWIKNFKKWFPLFLQQVWDREGGYALSSLKSDYRAVFGVDLDHASLGFPKLSDFMRTFPDLCEIKFLPIGKQKLSNHMILLPPKLPKSPRRVLQFFEKQSLPSWPTTPADDSHDSDSVDAKCVKELQLVPKVPSDHEIVDKNKENKPPSQSSRFLQFLKPDPIFHARPWLNCAEDIITGNIFKEEAHTGVLNGMKNAYQTRHLVLQALARQMNNTSMFFLREYDYYHKYRTCIAQGVCFGCKQRQSTWTNFPCGHRLWCSDCKLQATLSASKSKHKCVICDSEVRKLDCIIPAQQPAIV